jgi:hypothetical protein
MTFDDRLDEKTGLYSTAQNLAGGVVLLTALCVVAVAVLLGIGAALVAAIAVPIGVFASWIVGIAFGSGQQFAALAEAETYGAFNHLRYEANAVPVHVTADSDIGVITVELDKAAVLEAPQEDVHADVQARVEDAVNELLEEAHRG